MQLQTNPHHPACPSDIGHCLLSTHDYFIWPFHINSPGKLIYHIFMFSFSVVMLWASLLHFWGVVDCQIGSYLTVSDLLLNWIENMKYSKYGEQRHLLNYPHEMIIFQTHSTHTTSRRDVYNVHCTWMNIEYTQTYRQTLTLTHTNKLTHKHMFTQTH